MGNVVGGIKTKKKAKIMKIDGEIFKLKLPATAADVLGGYPEGYVLLESQSVKKYGIRAPRIQPEELLEPGKIYFLVDMPKFPEPETRRATSFAYIGGAKERLDRLKMAKRSASDIGPGSVRVKMRICHVSSFSSICIH
ncbi:Uncharacterized protein SHERM_06217 [Striga hermonthica]|uniref:Uncharacterized protein n=1 Tax=Striga hermonthica TaxID=68872 RepID=A0A9N7NV98_STRHE|nr:Uncharacterized protein SHERM_06217 [Striga hermonthica]